MGLRQPRLSLIATLCCAVATPTGCIRLDYDPMESSAVASGGGGNTTGVSGGSGDGLAGRPAITGTAGGGTATTSSPSGGTAVSSLGGGGSSMSQGGADVGGGTTAGGAMAAGGASTPGGAASGGAASGGATSSGGVNAGGAMAIGGTLAAAGTSASGGAALGGSVATGGVTVSAGASAGGQLASAGASTGGAAGASTSATAGQAGHGGTGINCDLPFDLFPTPITDSTTAFPSSADGVSFNNPADDAFMQIAFTKRFTFPFYGVTYSSLYLNTNGGLTFGAGDGKWSNLEAKSRTIPAIGVLWGDMNASDVDSKAFQRAGQMTYHQCSDRFVVTYAELQEGWTIHDYRNSATVSLFADGSIVIQYGVVMSTELLVGLFSGTHTSDAYVAVQATYSNYAQAGTSLILFDGVYDADLNPNPKVHAGELSNRTITYSP